VESLSAEGLSESLLTYSSLPHFVQLILIAVFHRIVWNSYLSVVLHSIAKCISPSLKDITNDQF